jgi:hypothetical protein
VAGRAGSRLAGRLVLLMFLLPALLLFFGVRSALYRYDQRSLAEQASAEVTGVERQVYTYRDSDDVARTGEQFRYTVALDLDGETITRPIVEANFDPQAVWHNSDAINPDIYAEGATMPVLLRRDLDNAVAFDGFWAIYLTPVFLIGFGLFALLICVPAYIVLRAPMPAASPMKREELMEQLRRRKRR